MRVLLKNNRTFFCGMRAKGHATVEFALVFPIFFLFTVAFLDFSLMGFKQMLLEHLGAALARELSASAYETSEEMQQAAEAWLAERSRDLIEPRVERRPLPTIPPLSAYRSPKSVYVIRLVLLERFESPFPLLRRLFQSRPLVLRSEVRDVQVKEEPAA